MLEQTILHLASAGRDEAGVGDVIAALLAQPKTFAAPRANSAAFVLQARGRDDDGPIRIGFTVTKKNGTATERNRIRRRLRELVKRLDVISMRPHSDYVLVGRRAALNRDFATMLDDLRSALHRLERQARDPCEDRPKLRFERSGHRFASASASGHETRDSRASRKPN